MITASLLLGAFAGRAGAGGPSHEGYAALDARVRDLDRDDAQLAANGRRARTVLDLRAPVLALASSLGGMACCTVGTHVHVAAVPPFAGDLGSRLPTRLTERASIEYLGARFEALGEIGFVDDAPGTAKRTLAHVAGHLQLEYRLGAFTPYTRFDQRQVEGRVAAVAAGVDQWQQVFGIRYALGRRLAITLEGAGGRAQRWSVGAETTSRGFGRIAAQVAWSF